MLANNVGLTSLDLNKNPVTEDGVNAFAEVIQRNTGLIQVPPSWVRGVAKWANRFIGELVVLRPRVRVRKGLKGMLRQFC